MGKKKNKNLRRIVKSVMMPGCILGRYGGAGAIYFNISGRENDLYIFETDDRPIQYYRDRISTWQTRS